MLLVILRFFPSFLLSWSKNIGVRAFCDTSITILTTYTSITVYFYRRGLKESKAQKRWVSHYIQNFVFYIAKEKESFLTTVYFWYFLLFKVETIAHIMGHSCFLLIGLTLKVVETVFVQITFSNIASSN